MILLPFCKKKNSIFSKIWYQKQILWLIYIPEMYTFIYITVIVRKLQHAIFIHNFWVNTPLNTVLISSFDQGPRMVTFWQNMSHIYNCFLLNNLHFFGYRYFSSFKYHREVYMVSVCCFWFLLQWITSEIFNLLHFHRQYRPFSN